MHVCVCAAVFALQALQVMSGGATQSAPKTQTPPKTQTAQKPAAPAVDPEAQAYEEFLLGRHRESADDINGAIAAYKRAMALDPKSAEVPAELAALYLRQNRAEDALASAEQALKIDPANREANRVAGFVYTALAEPRGTGRTAPPPDSEANLAKAIQHLEAAIAGPVGEADANVRATLARLYLRTEVYDKAIPLLSDLVRQEPGWQDGPDLLAEAYAGAGRNRDAIAWLEQAVDDDPELYPTLADFYERERRWSDAAAAYEKAIPIAPRNTELKNRYASALINAGDRQHAAKARDVLTELLAARPNDARALYLLSQAQRRTGDSTAAEATARKVIAANGKSPWGYYALAEALEERQQYQAVVDALSPAVADARTRSGDSLPLTLLLPHLGFAQQELGHLDKAIPIFEEAHRLSPEDPAVAGYLIEALIAAKKYPAAIQAAEQARAGRSNDVRLSRLEAQALRQNGKPDEAVALLQGAAKAHEDDPSSYVSLAQLYADLDRGDEAVKVLQDALGRFPADDTIPFELGAVFDKQKRFADAEAAFKALLARDPENAAALNYLGYMLAERGERLDESVAYIKKALELEPDNGSYLDSLGWAYFKADKLDLAEANLKRAADQMLANSVIQDHYGDVLFKRGRLTDAIAAWTQALAGDGDSIDRDAIDKKIRSARQKLGKK